MSPTPATPVHRAMRPRDPGEPHRVSSPLELFFDLVFVVAISSAAGQWHHALSAGHLTAIAGYLAAFFAIWWAWMNYSWFASAYDSRDVTFRLLTFAIMTGSLMLAAGIPDLFADSQSGLAVAGYAVMRFGMVALWLRAARGDGPGRATALRYAAGIAAVQVFWILRLLAHDQVAVELTFVIGVVLELLVPPLAERDHRTPFHPEHVTERYALFTIIVLGEVILSSVQAVNDVPTQGFSVDLLAVVIGGLLTVYSIWWVYFTRDHLELFAGPLRHNLTVGYGHFAVFAAIAATGAGLGACVDVVTGTAEASPRVIGLGFAVPVAVYLVMLATFHALADRRWASATNGGVTAACVVALALLGLPVAATVLGIGVILALAVAATVWSTREGRTTVPAG